LCPNFCKPFLDFRVLKDVGYLYKRHGYRVKAADQWHQPLELPSGEIVWDPMRAGFSTKSSTENSFQAADPMKPSLMDLNDDCILYILKFLSLNELIGIERGKFEYSSSFLLTMSVFIVLHVTGFLEMG